MDADSSHMAPCRHTDTGQTVSDRVQNETSADRLLNALGNVYLRLPESAYARHTPQPVEQPQLISPTTSN